MATTERVITPVKITFAPGKKQYKFALNHWNPEPSIYEVHSESDRRPTDGGRAYFPNSHSFICEDEVYDPQTGTMRIIRYIKGESTIFADEQITNEYTKVERLEFTQKNFGIVTIPKENKVLLQFLSMTDYNQSKEGRNTGKKAIFRYVDEQKIYDTQLDNELILDKAKTLALNASFDELIELAMGMEPPINIEGREEKAIRWDMLQRAKYDPQGFLETQANPDTKKKAMLRKAEEARIINKTQSGFSWANGQMFLIVPPGQNAYEFFVNQRSNEMQMVYDSILSMLEAKQGRKTVTTMNKTAEVVLTPESSSIDEREGKILQAAGTTGLVSKLAYSTEVENVWNEAVKKGIVERSPNTKSLSRWLGYSEKYAPKKTWMDRLGANPTLLQKLKDEVASK